MTQMKILFATPLSSLLPETQHFFGRKKNIPAAASTVCKARKSAASRGEFSNLRAINSSN
jgi:hypothetical protein